MAADSAKMSLTQAQRVELDRRIAEHETSPNDVLPWEEVKASIIERLSEEGHNRVN